jgi:hypothetical protein
MSQKDFKEKGYCVVKAAISDELRDFVTQCSLFDEMQNFAAEGDSLSQAQVPDAHSVYANPIMEAMLLHLQNIMEENTGLELYPTYSYYRVYRNGDSLDRHTDRPSCQISATLCFNYSYDDSVFSWPIYMDGKKVDLSPGDMVIYRGMELEHWRETLENSDDVWHVQGFFHYVDANGPHADFKFDRRESIGIKPANKKTTNNQIISPKPYLSPIR